MYRIIDILDTEGVHHCLSLVGQARFADGRVTNPHSKVKNNLQLYDQQAYQQSGAFLRQMLLGNEEFQRIAFPVRIAPPLISRYLAGHHYGMHADAAFLPLDDGPLRSDLSCTIFLSDPADYDGGALHIRHGDADLRFKLNPGQAIIYPSTSLHEVEPVTKGERVVAITFIESRIPDPAKRDLLFELNEIAALEGLNMHPDHFTKLQWVQSNLMRLWSVEG